MPLSMISIGIRNQIRGRAHTRLCLCQWSRSGFGTKSEVEHTRTLSNRHQVNLIWGLVSTSLLDQRPRDADDAGAPVLRLCHRKFCWLRKLLRLVKLRGQRDRHSGWSRRLDCVPLKFNFVWVFLDWLGKVLIAPHKTRSWSFPVGCTIKLRKSTCTIIMLSPSQPWAQFCVITIDGSWIRLGKLDEFDFTHAQPSNKRMIRTHELSLNLTCTSNLHFSRTNFTFRKWNNTDFTDFTDPWNSWAMCFLVRACQNSAFN